MPRRNNRLIFLAITLISLTLYWSCSQPGDVIREKSTTIVSLTSERLPSPPEGMIYELWVCKNEVVDISVAASDVKSLGRFLFDNDVKKYYDENGVEIENRFILDDDIFSYSKIFVSVELITDPDAGRPGPIMLIDDITLPDENPMYMVFPLSDSLHEATSTFNKETVSDRDTANVGQGIWFCNYDTGTHHIVDTLAIYSVTYVLEDAPDSLLEISCSLDVAGDTLFCDTQVKLSPWDTLSTTVQVIDVVYGPDTIAYVDNITHTRVEIVYDSIIDDTPPYQIRKITPNATTSEHSVDLHIFSQFDFNLPDYSSYGWTYKGWIVSKTIPSSAIGDFTPPAWPYHTNNYNYIPGYTGGLLTTGTFSQIAAPDDANPFTIEGVKVPPYPGEDYLNSAALAPLGLDPMPNLNSDSGTIFITLEPLNLITDTTNFPLYVMIKGIDPAFNNQLMFNRTGTIKGDLFWFPEITVNIEKNY